jgi:AcrR family transcriptional regulator
VATRKESKAQTREALLRAGMALFREQGLDAPSLDAICERAGKTRGAFYVHFEDRDDFLVAVMDKVGREFLDAVLRANIDFDTAVSAFAAAFASGVYPISAAGGVRPHQLLDACARSPKVRKRYVSLIEATIQRLTLILQLDQAKGRVRADVPGRDLAAILLALVIGAHTLQELRAPLDPDTTAAAVRKLTRP